MTFQIYFMMNSSHLFHSFDVSPRNNSGMTCGLL